MSPISPMRADESTWNFHGESGLGDNILIPKLSILLKTSAEKNITTRLQKRIKKKAEHEKKKDM